MTTKTKVFVASGSYAKDVAALFNRKGYQATTNLNAAKIVCFTGGVDVNPALYGEAPIKGVDYDIKRDNRDISTHSWCADKIKVGICRGGQFLNVMNGGKLWQNVDGHGGTHPARDLLSDRIISVSSTHHQMMIPAKHGIVAMVARMSNIKEADGRCVANATSKSPDVEVVLYPDTKTICFQPHPEFVMQGAGKTYEGCADYFFKLIKEMENS